MKNNSRNQELILAESMVRLAIRMQQVQGTILRLSETMKELNTSMEKYMREQKDQ